LLKQDSDLFVFIQPVPGDWSAFEILSILFRYCFDLWPSGEFSAEKERERCLVKEKKAVCRDGSSMVRPFDKLPPQAGRPAYGWASKLATHGRPTPRRSIVFPLNPPSPPAYGLQRNRQAE